MTPGYRHMALAALVSAFAWVDSSVNRLVQGAGYHKAYLFPSRDAVLADQVMIEGLALTKTGNWYHQQKDLWTRFLEVAHGDRGNAKAGEEMQSKYFAFCGVSAGFMLGFGTTVIIFAAAFVVWKIIA